MRVSGSPFGRSLPQRFRNRSADADAPDVRSNRTTRARTVGAEIRTVVRAITAVALVLLVLNVGARAWLLLQLAPEVTHLRATAEQLDVVHEGMVDEETG